MITANTEADIPASRLATAIQSPTLGEQIQFHLAEAGTKFSNAVMTYGAEHSDELRGVLAVAAGTPFIAATAILRGTLPASEHQKLSDFGIGRS